MADRRGGGNKGGRERKKEIRGGDSKRGPFQMSFKERAGFAAGVDNISWMDLGTGM